MALPSGYTKLEYIESTGTQYIDTGVSAPSGVAISCEVMLTGYVGSYNSIFGAHDTNSPYYRDYLVAKNNGIWELGAYGFSQFGAPALNIKLKIDCCTISGAISCVINGAAQSVDTTIGGNGVRSSLSMYLFGMNYSGGINPAKMRLYSCKIYLDSSKTNLVRDFIPCKNVSGTVGLWDSANSKFYSGTGGFTAGPPLVDLTAHKTLVNGTAYEVKGGKCLVNGTAYSIKKGRTLIGGTGYDITFASPYDPVFANNTWEQIIAACHNNEVPDTWKVKDHKPMTIGGKSYQVDIIGKNHDTYASGGKAPLTFQLHDCYGETKNINSSNTNYGGWTSCAMRQTHLPNILSRMPTEVQNGIREVNKLTAQTMTAAINTTADKLFLLSEIEIFGSVIYSKSGEGTQYDYYKAGNSKVKNYNGSAYYWWERSPYGSDSALFCFVNSDGNADYRYESSAIGVAFGFCF